ncbi:hypothetical protein QQF64_032696 [Cirrhinus molitorella]|uniref:Uncharacterized protein n=1 Tax=Cirrhinus molitorella TaxID=172907 RepID=A0ABR3MRR7_9TELE
MEIGEGGGGDAGEHGGGAEVEHEQLQRLRAKLQLPHRCTVKVQNFCWLQNMSRKPEPQSEEAQHKEPSVTDQSLTQTSTRSGPRTSGHFYSGTAATGSMCSTHRKLQKAPSANIQLI